jgi:biopolymer transport protein ExbB
VGTSFPYDALGYAQEPSKAATVQEFFGFVLPVQLDSALQLLLAGGPVVGLLVALSVFSFGIILLKFWQFIWLRVESSNNIKASLSYWHSGDSSQALQTLNTANRVQSIVYEAMQGVAEQQNPLLLQKELGRQANALIHELRLYLRPLEVIANMSPLLGLMGTVIGMIIAFQQMEAAGSQVNPSVLSGGIWQALLTTAAGLAVAIPVAVIHGYFERKVERVSHRINDAVTQVFTTHTRPTVDAGINDIGEMRAA